MQHNEGTWGMLLKGAIQARASPMAAPCVHVYRADGFTRPNSVNTLTWPEKGFAFRAPRLYRLQQASASYTSPVLLPRWWPSRRADSRIRCPRTPLVPYDPR